MNDSIQIDVERATRQWMAAMAGKDEQGITSAHGDGFRGITADGRHVDTAEHVARVMGSHVESTLEEFQTRSLESVVVAWGTQSMTASAPEGAFSPELTERLNRGVRTTFTQVWTQPTESDHSWRCVASQVTEIAPRSPDVSLTEMEANYERWRLIVAGRDRAGLEELLHEDYVFTTPEGIRMARRDVIDLEMSTPAPEGVMIDSLQAVSADVVIVRGHDDVKGDFPEGAVSPELAARMAGGITIAFSTVWSRASGAWKVVSNDAHVAK